MQRRQGEPPQHLIAIDAVLPCGAGETAQRALEQVDLRRAPMDHLAIYDSVTITLAMLLERSALRHVVAAPPVPAPATSVRRARCLHGGLLSYGHFGVADGMANAVEAVTQLTGRVGIRQVPRSQHALVHADGGRISSNASLVRSREG